MKEMETEHQRVMQNVKVNHTEALEKQMEEHAAKLRERLQAVEERLMLDSLNGGPDWSDLAAQGAFEPRGSANSSATSSSNRQLNAGDGAQRHSPATGGSVTQSDSFRCSPSCPSGGPSGRPSFEMHSGRYEDHHAHKLQATSYKL